MEAHRCHAVFLAEGWGSLRLRFSVYLSNSSDIGSPTHSVGSCLKKKNIVLYEKLSLCYSCICHVCACVSLCSIVQRMTVMTVIIILVEGGGGKLVVQGAEAQECGESMF